MRAGEKNDCNVLCLFFILTRRLFIADKQRKTRLAQGTGASELIKKVKPSMLKAPGTVSSADADWASGLPPAGWAAAHCRASCWPLGESSASADPGRGRDGLSTARGGRPDGARHGARRRTGGWAVAEWGRGAACGGRGRPDGERRAASQRSGELGFARGVHGQGAALGGLLPAGPGQGAALRSSKKLMGLRPEPWPRRPWAWVRPW